MQWRQNQKFDTSKCVFTCILAYESSTFTSSSVTPTSVVQALGRNIAGLC